MTATLDVTVLDVADPDAVRAYERAFFAAFRRATANRLVRKLWIWVMENERLATRIPYEDQLIYVLKEESGAVRIAMAANLALRGSSPRRSASRRPTLPASSKY